ncbi:MAG TPA: threonine/serine dehydratase [Candidatus Dormibacteraeota bacterium]|nr:threonine/serine dehydratase [Candidatus Dormibacteraeota bacterium]
MVRPATIIEAPRLSAKLGAKVILASETFQTTGSFKFRAAFHLASHVPEKLIIAASSGNFGQALACACSMLGKASIIVMPATSVKVKIDAVREYGGAVELVDVRVKSRAERLAEIAAQHPEAYVASAYDDPLVIEGNASLGRELATLNYTFDSVLVPIGGGGLAAGFVKGICESGKGIAIIGAEPSLGNDAARSLRAGFVVANETEPDTIADGARTLKLGRLNWGILRGGLQGIIEVGEREIEEGTRLLFELANLKAEPTGALSVGALLSEPERFRNRTVCCVISGGNVDPALYAEIISRVSC